MEESANKFALNMSSTPAKVSKCLELSEMGAESEDEDLGCSPRSLGIDFV